MVPDGPVLEHALFRVFRSDLKNAARNKELLRIECNISCINSWSKSYLEPFQFSLFQNECNRTKPAQERQQEWKMCINSCMRLDYRLETSSREERIGEFYTINSFDKAQLVFSSFTVCILSIITEGLKIQKVLFDTFITPLKCIVIKGYEYQRLTFSPLPWLPKYHLCILSPDKHIKEISLLPWSCMA